MDKAKRNIKPFDGEKYSVWKFRIRALLSELDVIKVIDQDVPGKVDENWKKAERCAKSTLIEYLSDSFLNFASSDTSARQILENLDAIYERKSLASQLAARKRLLSLKLKSEMPLLSHFTAFDELVSELLAAGARIDEMDKVSHLLLTLPSSYNGVITAIETLSEDNLTLAFVKNRLLDHEIKLRSDSNDTSRKVMKVFAPNNNSNNNSFRNYNNNNNNNSSVRNRVARPSKVFKGKQKLNFRCHHCGREGHMKKDCFYYKKIINEKNKENKQAQVATSLRGGFAFMLKANNLVQDKCGFILDSGATDHIINDESLFADSVELEYPIKISVAKQGSYIYATKRGIVRLHNGHEITLEDVLFCKEASGNLISVKRLQEAEMSIEFDKNGVTISKNGVIVFKNSDKQLADIFTKPLPAARFLELRNQIGLVLADDN